MTVIAKLPDNTTVTTEQAERHRELWTLALDSGKYQQARESLAAFNEEDDAIGYCCLGVACEVAIANGVPWLRHSQHDPTIYEYLDWPTDSETGETLWDREPEWRGEQNSELPRPLADWLGMSNTAGALARYIEIEGDSPGEATHLIALNDTAEWNFTQIANVIRSGNLALLTGEE